MIQSAHGSWSAWNHGLSMTGCYRRHLQNNHQNEWVETCKSGNLKLLSLSSSNMQSSRQIPFTLEMFYHLLLKWIAVDDQVCHTMRPHLSPNLLTS